MSAGTSPSLEGRRTYSEREVVLRERNACAKEYVTNACASLSTRNRSTESLWREAQAYAAREYPLPMVECARVLRDPHEGNFEWMARGGVLLVRNHTVIAQSASLFGRVGAEFGAFEPTPERVAMWADLLANPVSRVPDDGGQEGAGHA